MPTATALRGALLAALVALAAPAAAAELSKATSDLVTAIAADDTARAAAAIAAGADVDADIGDGRTPLIGAVMFIRPAIVKLLLEHGADPSRRAGDETIGNALTAAFFAMSGTELTGRGDAPDARKHAAALEVLELAAKSKASPNLLVRRATTSMSVLMIAAEAGALDAVQVLLAAGADPNVTNGGKYTALDYAVDRKPAWSPATPANRAGVVKALLAAGARTDRKPADGITVLERAKRGGNPEIVALLTGR
jgi:ankyrin repeat protein